MKDLPKFYIFKVSEILSIWNIVLAPKVKTKCQNIGQDWLYTMFQTFREQSMNRSHLQLDAKNLYPASIGMGLGPLFLMMRFSENIVPKKNNKPNESKLNPHLCLKFVDLKSKI